MIYLLSDDGRQALRALAAKPLLYAFDFDGTLAPLSADRNAVTLPPTIAEWLRELSTRVPCAIISGRACADLEGRINRTAPYLIGNHGLESPLTPQSTLRWAEGICTAWKETLATVFAPSLKDRGITVEDKRYSLTLHYSASESGHNTGMAWPALLHHLSPAPRLIAGHASINLLPPGQYGKGQAALALMTHLRRTGLFFIGDDQTDEEVFALREGLAMGVRVGRDQGTKAAYYLRRQHEIEDVLRFLVHRLDRTPEALGHQGSPSNDSHEAAHDV